MEIVSTNSNFDFKTASLADPQPLTGQAGFYFTQLSVGAENKSLCLQLPDCVTKQGIVNVKNAKYLDLMFERNKHDELMRWVEKLEYTCQDIIDAKKDLWFQTELTRDDIETMMTQITRLYQSGKYVLMRVFIDVNKGGQKCIAYDENEIGFDLDILEANKTVIPLVMIEGVKFSSRSFEISLKLVQVMVLGNTEKKSSCLIKRAQDIIMPVLEKPLPINRPILAKKTVQAPTLQVYAPKVQVQTPTVQTPTVQTPTVQTPKVLVQTPTVQVQTPKVQAPIAKVLAPMNMLRENVTTSRPATVSRISVGEKTIKPILKPTVGGNTVPLSNATVGNTTVGNATPLASALAPLASATVGANALAPLANIIISPPSSDMEEVNINFSDLSDSISLKNPNEVYYEIYKQAREKAKDCRQKAIEAYLEAKQIKTKYLLHDLDDLEDSEDSEDDDNENYNVDSD
jgi:hypothetical protein